MFQIKTLNNVIYNSIKNIANYDKNNKNFFNSVNVINDVVIKPILEAELINSYKNGDENKITRIKNRFFDAIIITALSSSKVFISHILTFITCSILFNCISRCSFRFVFFDFDLEVFTIWV